MRILLILLVLLPSLLGAQVKNAYKFLGKKQFAEAETAFVTDTSNADPATRVLAYYGLSQVYGVAEAPAPDYVKAYGFLDQASKGYRKLNAAAKEQTAKYDLTSQAITTARSQIAQARYAQLEAAPNADAIQAFLGWPELPSSVKGKAQRLFTAAGGKAPEPVATGPAVPMERKVFSEKDKAAFEAYLKANAPSVAAEGVLYNMLRFYGENKQWDSVAAVARRYRPLFPPKDVWLANVVAIAESRTYGVNVQRLGTNINTAGREYVPVVTADDQRLYFCGVGRADNLSKKEDVFASDWTNGEWGPAKVVPLLSTPKSNDSPLSITADGNRILIFREGALYYCDKSYGGWSVPEAVSVANDNFGWVGISQLAANGQVLLFEAVVSRLDQHTNTNLYISLRDSVGQWQKPFAIDALNTDSLDRAPYLHPDMHTLYFSSGGLEGLGGMDVYVSTRLDDTWRNWSPPRHLGKELNSFDDDWGYKITTDGTKAYFAAGPRGENMDIFVADLPEDMRPRQVSTIRGQLLDTDKRPVGAEIIFEDLANGEIVGLLRSDPNTGYFFATLPNEREYSYYIKKDGYFPQANHLDLRKHEGSVKLTENIQLVRVDQMAEEGLTVAMKNLFFDTGKSIVKPNSMPELKRIMKIIMDTDFNVEIAGYTDNVGSDQTNKALSDARAKAVRAALIKLGCPAERLRAVGYGESNPSHDNSTEEGRAKNRRVELSLKPK